MPFYMPNLYDEQTSAARTDTFLGLHNAMRISDGELFDMKNLTSDDAPLLSVRKKRGKVFLYTDETVPIHKGDPVCLTAKTVTDRDGYDSNVLCYLDAYTDDEGATKYGLAMGERFLSLGLSSADSGRRRMVHMGAYLVIVPDMVYVNCANPDDFGPIKDELTKTDGAVGFTVVDFQGQVPDYIQTQRPDQNDAGETVEITNGTLWWKGEPNATEEEAAAVSGGGLYRYDADTLKWLSETPYYVVSLTSINADGFSVPQKLALTSPLQDGDPLFFEGMGDLDGVHALQLPELYGGTRYVVTGLPITTYSKTITATEANPITIGRVVPVLDYVCECDNRLWGCRYGDNGRGEFVNEIYCSARGDFYKWISGAADDPDAPVTFSLGSDGPFTAAVSYGGYPTFFKEKMMHRVSGSGASGYGVYDNPCVGVAMGADKSLATVGNVLYYKADGAVMAYDGSSPVSVSEKLGKLYAFGRAVGGACGGKYYLSLYNENPNEPNAVLYVFDTERGLWHKEDATEAESMASVGDNLYVNAVRRSALGVTHEIFSVIAQSGEVPEEDVPWFAETGILGMETEDAKYLCKIALRLSLDAGSHVRVSVEYDSCGEFVQVMATEAPSLRTVTLPIIPRRCDHLRLRLDGVGGCRVFSLVKTFEKAEDL